MLVIIARSFACCFFNISLDRIIRHIIRLCLCNNIAQTTVICRIRSAAFFYRHSKFSSDLCKNLSLSRIVFFFLMFNICKL